MRLGTLPDMGSNARAVLADNLNRLMANSKDLNSIKKLNAVCGVGTGTIDRIRREVSSTSVDNVASIAAAFDLEAWQLLVPNLEVTNPPILASEDDALRRLYGTLRHTTEAIEGHLRDGGNTKPGTLD